MYDLIDKWKLEQPLIFSIYACHIRTSIAQIQWLLEMTGASLLVWGKENDQIPMNDLLLLRYKFSKERVYFDLPSNVKQQFDPLKHEGESRLSEELKALGVSSLKAENWKIMQTKTGSKIYLGHNSVLLQRGLLVSKDKIEATSSTPLRLGGRIEFIDITEEVDDLQNAAFEVLLRVSQSSIPETLSGIKCLIRANGHIEIRTQSIPGVDLFQEVQLSGSSYCYHFEISDILNDSLTLHVKRPSDCTKESPNSSTEGQVHIPVKDLKADGAFIGLRASVGEGFVALQELILHST